MFSQVKTVRSEILETRTVSEARHSRRRRRAARLTRERYWA